MSSAAAADLLRRAQTLHQAGKLDEAEDAYLRVATLVPANPDLWHLLGVLAYQRGDAAQAIERYRKALELRPGIAQAHNNLALALNATGQHEAAANAFGAALAARPDYAEAAYNLALLHEERGDVAGAEKAYRHALSVKSDWPELLGNLGNLLRTAHRVSEAAPFLERALALRAHDPDAIGNVALLRIDQGRYGEGRVLAERATTLAPDSVRWWEAAGSAARLMGDADGAVPSLRRAVDLAPGDAALWFELGLALEACADHTGAREAVGKASVLAPDWERLRWAEALMTPRIASSSEDAAQAVRQFDAGLDRLERGQRLDTSAQREGALEAAESTLPINLHYLPGDHFGRQCRFADLVGKSVRAALPAFATPLSARPIPVEDRLRVGFVSSYLRHHVVARFFAAFITELERDEFEKWVWFTGEVMDDWSREIAAAADHFEHGAAPVAALAERIRDAGLDVLVYPDLGLDPRQHALAALRLAPVQAALYGHPVTSGLDSVDFFLSGEALELPGSESQYREALVRLPGLGARPRAPVPRGHGRWANALRLPGRPLLMCLQNLSKLPPEFDDVIAEILGRSGARIVFFDRGPRLSAVFRKRFERALQRRSIDAAALHIERVHDYGEFLGGIAEADLILDSPGFSGGATSLDALGVGAAVLCLNGSTARGRQTAAILRCVEVPELIASDFDDYTRLALDLLADRSRLASLRARIGAHAGRIFDDRSALAGFAAFLRNVCGRATLP